MSPYVVLYAELLLLAQYIYGLNLKEELPDKVNGIDLTQIGLGHMEGRFTSTSRKSDSVTWKVSSDGPGQCRY